MDAIEFISRYPTYIAQLSKVVKPEYQPVIRNMNKLDPHDVVRPEHYFNSEAEAIGIVYRLFLRKMKEIVPHKITKDERRRRKEHQISAAKKLLAANGLQTHGLWSIEDILEKARELKKRCGKKTAKIILSQIENNFDAEVGITWQTIEE